jgi:hypothetical protein
MTMRDRSTASLATRRPTAQSGHLGRRTGLVDEDELQRVEIGLAGEPGLAPACDVRPILLGGVRGFF